MLRAAYLPRRPFASSGANGEAGAQMERRRAASGREVPSAARADPGIEGPAHARLALGAAADLARGERHVVTSGRAGRRAHEAPGSRFARRQSAHSEAELWAGARPTAERLGVSASLGRRPQSVS